MTPNNTQTLEKEYLSVKYIFDSGIDMKRGRPSYKNVFLAEFTSDERENKPLYSTD